MRTRFMRRSQDCGICHSSIHEQGVLDSCAHAFCLVCILKWAEIENSCPLCKARFSQVAARWTRKCYRESNTRTRRTYHIARRDQGQCTLRVVVPWADEDRVATLLRYLETMLQESFEVSFR